MEFPHTFFEDEVREGFYISGLIKHSWAAQIEVLQEIAKVCRRHGIKWFADCGTLLGTVRHGGYIPWDDDLDICMLRPDYEKFLKYADKELPKGYVVLTCYKEDEDYFEHLTRVANEHKLNFDKEFVEKYHECPYATGIDIFPLDYIAEDEEEEDERKLLLTFLMTLSDEIAADGSNVSKYKKEIREAEKICDYKIDYKRSVKHQLFQMVEKIFALYSQNRGKYVALMPYWVYFNNHKYPAECFDKTVMMPFEITEMPVPAAYDAVLRIEYGDYMKIYKGGGVHEYPCYEKQENHLIKALKKEGHEYIFKYKFDIEDTKNENRIKHDRPRVQTDNYVELINQAHQAILKSIIDGRFEETISLLTACQEGAIQIGNMLEKYYGEGFATVKVLEEYCEIIFQIGELVGEASDTGVLGLPIADIGQYLLEIFRAIKTSVEENVIDRKEILFMPVKANAWGTLDGLWKKAKEDPNNHVVVMPIPYYERNAVGGPTTMHYEGKDFPEYLEIVNYEDYDLVFRHPDEIYIHNAYDQCNYSTSIAPQYYTSNIKQYTDKLIYVPWFILDEMGADSDKARKVMQFYCTVPGLSHADEVLVQSEETRQEYIRCLTEFAGAATRAIWENKICVYEDVKNSEGFNRRVFDKKAYLSDFPEEWQKTLTTEAGDIKKVILYNTSVASYMQSGEKLFDKIENNLQLFGEYKDKLAVIWRPHRELRQMINQRNPELVKRYDKIHEEFSACEIGVCDTGYRLDEVLPLCDAFYGDADGVAHRCNVENLPVMIQNVDI